MFECLTQADSPAQMNLYHMNTHFLRGLRHGSPFILVAIPFALLFGVVSTEAGLSALQTMGFSVIVIAGASQFAAVAQMIDGAPLLIVVATALAVNMRMAMYSAALAPYLRGLNLPRRVSLAYMLVDQSYLLSAIEFEKNRAMSPQDRFAYFVGSFLPLGVFWYGASAVGALTGALIPAELALDFIMPLAFLSMVAPAIKTWAHAGAAVVSVILTLALSDMPYGTGLIVAAIAALVTGSFIEVLRERRT